MSYKLHLPKLTYELDAWCVDDCVVIQSVIAEHGYAATLSECEELWGIYSESMAAGWMTVHRDIVWDCVSPFIEP